MHRIREISFQSGKTRFMSSEMGMCSNTVWKRFSVFDFTELELKGLNEAYREYFATLISEGEHV